MLENSTMQRHFNSVPSAFLAIFTLTYLQQYVYADEIGCFVEGECTQSLLVDKWHTSDAQGCLDSCKSCDTCEFFTYYGGSDDLCLGLANCVELDDEYCEECYSGNRTCQGLQCWVRDRCVGSTVSIYVTPNENACFQDCKQNDRCNWFTFDEVDGTCILFEDCNNLGNNGCDTCWSSQVQCEERQDFSKVLVISGCSDNVGTYLDNVEVVDLSTETPLCDPVSNYPFPVGFPVGTILDGFPTVCGGYNPDLDLYTSECYQYFYQENRWSQMEVSMIEERYYHKSSMIDTDTWLITGGKNNDGVMVSSTEVWQNGQFQQGPFLPTPLGSHCQVTLNSSYVAILGGNDGTDYVTKFYLLDWNNKEWIAMPDVPFLIGNDVCGIIRNDTNGAELVALENNNHSYIFNFMDMTWRDGPSMPFNIRVDYRQMSVQMQDTFYIFGGYNSLNETATDAIFKFDNENYTWNLETARLQKARKEGVAIAVPDEMVNCN